MRWWLWLLFGWSAVVLVFFIIITSNPANAAQQVDRARILMMATTVLIWGVLGGGCMYTIRDKVRAVVSRLRPWQLTFILFSIALACIEEFITTTLSNYPQLFGDPSGTAMITASRDYLTVITQHSVIAFVPWIIGLAIVLTFFKLSPAKVFLIFGVMGSLAEAALSGQPGHLIAGFWIIIYGLMVWLPAYCIPQKQRPLQKN